MKNENIQCDLLNKIKGILYGQQPQTDIGPGVPDQIRGIILAGYNFNLCGEQCLCLIVSGNGAGAVQSQSL